MNDRRTQSNRTLRLLRGVLVLTVVLSMITGPFALIAQPVLAQSSMVDAKMAVVGLDGAGANSSAETGRSLAAPSRRTRLAETQPAPSGRSSRSTSSQALSSLRAAMFNSSPLAALPRMR